MRSVQNAAILVAGLCLGVLAVSPILREQPELNGANLNGLSANGLTTNGTQVTGQFSPTISSEVSQSTTTATINNRPVQTISLKGGQLIFHVDNAQ